MKPIAARSQVRASRRRNTPADVVTAGTSAATTASTTAAGDKPLDTFGSSRSDAPRRHRTNVASAPVTAGHTLRRHGHAHPSAPKNVPMPDGSSADITQAATALWKKYAGDPKTKVALESELEGSMFDPMVDAVNDDYRMGMLMRAIPLDPAPVAVPFGPLQVTTLVVETATAHKVDAPLDRIREALAANPKSDIFLAPEWLFVPPCGFHTAAEMEAIVAALVDISKSTPALMVPGTIAWVDDNGAYHNTALALEGGKILKRYDKRNDGDDEAFAKEHGATYARGQTDSLFQWKGRTVALEICRDHGDARARWDLESTAMPTVDLQLVVSCGVDLKHPAVGMGGIALVANGDANAPEGAEFWGGRRVPLEREDHPLFVRTEHQTATTTPLSNGAQVRTMVV